MTEKSRTILICVGACLLYLAWNQEHKASVKAAQEAKRESEINLCIADAKAEYDDWWSSACQSKYDDNKTLLDNCIKNAISLSGDDMQATEISNCKATYSETEYDPACSLDRGQANSFNSALKDKMNLCVKIYS